MAFSSDELVPIPSMIIFWVPANFYLEKWSKLQEKVRSQKGVEYVRNHYFKGILQPWKRSG